jgi:hypothetical protein
MERTTSIITAGRLFGKNFIGPTELLKIAPKFPVNKDLIKNDALPPITFDTKQLKQYVDTHILILGISENNLHTSLTINFLRDFYGTNPEQNEPCFYNQDWYINENFANKTTLECKWYLIRKKITKSSQGKNPQALSENFTPSQNFPSAILTAYTFFAYYFHTGGDILWKNEFVWCKDVDHADDQIYTGRYEDPSQINKKGFNVHRHLSIKPFYGLAETIMI